MCKKSKIVDPEIIDGAKYSAKFINGKDFLVQFEWNYCNLNNIVKFLLDNGAVSKQVVQSSEFYVKSRF